VHVEVTSPQRSRSSDWLCDGPAAVAYCSGSLCVWKPHVNREGRGAPVHGVWRTGLGHKETPSVAPGGTSGLQVKAGQRPVPPSDLRHLLLPLGFEERISGRGGAAGSWRRVWGSKQC